jgi:hypothetical protein
MPADTSKSVPLLDEQEVDALLQAVAGTVLSPEAAAVAEAARTRLLRPPLRLIDGGEGWDPEALFEHRLYGGG